jgi:hypothetical protein
MFLHTLLIATDFPRWNRLSGISWPSALKIHRLFLGSKRPTPTGVDDVGIRTAPCDAMLMNRRPLSMFLAIPITATLRA